MKKLISLFLCLCLAAGLAPGSSREKPLLTSDP